MIEDSTEHFDELLIAVGVLLQLRANLGQGERQIPILERRAVAQGPRLAYQHRQVMPGVVDDLVTPELTRVVGHHLVVEQDHTAQRPMRGLPVGCAGASHAERIVVLLDDDGGGPTTLVSSGRYQIIYDPWHYLPVLVRKPGALRNGAPSRIGICRSPWPRFARKLKQHADGDQQFVKSCSVLSSIMVCRPSTPPVAEALAAGIASGDVILTVLARRRQPEMPPSITTPDALRLKIEPAADCGRYDSIRKVA